MSKTLKIVLYVLVGLFVLYTVLGFLVVPWAITNKLPPMLTEELNRPVSIQEASFNPFLFKLQAKGFAIQEEDGSPLAGFDELFVDFEALSSLKNQAYTFDQIRLGLPHGLAIIRQDGSLNFAELGKPSDEKLPPQEMEPSDSSSEEPAGLPPVLIRTMQIQQGMLEFQDVTKPTPFIAHIVPINLTLENFSTQKGQANPYALSAELQEGEKISWEGTLTLEPVESQGDLTLENIQLSGLWAYFQDPFRFRIPQGLGTLKGHYVFSTHGDDVDVNVDQGRLTLQDVRIQDKDAAESVIDVPFLEVDGVSVDVGKQMVRIPTAKGKDGRLVGWLDEDGTMNYQDLFSPIDSDSDSTPDATSSDDADSDNADSSWEVLVDDFDLENFTVDFEDRQPEPTVALLFESVHFHTSQFSTALDQALPMELSFQFNQTGEADLKGAVNIDPFSIDADIALTEIAPAPFQGYFSPFVQFDVGGGAMTLAGKTQYQDTQTSQPMVTFQGDVDVSQLALMDPMQSKAFLKWEGLKFQDFELTVEPTMVKVKEIALVKPEVVLAIDQDGNSNMKRLFAPPGQIDEPSAEDSEGQSIEGEESPTEEASSPPLPVQVETVRIDNLQLQVADRSITPNVATMIEEFTGTIKGLSSEQLAKADVDLTGKVDTYAPFKIKGQINPLSEDAYTDVSLVFENLNLTTISPYSGKYAGYPITKGKLSLDLAYKLSQSELEGKNKVIVDQITMGSEVESADATSLPIPLALALLKDRKGLIDIDLPISGNIDDPEFSYGGIIWNALLNLITKIATSPFSLVGGLVGGVMGDDPDALKYIAFPAGAKEMPPTEQEKLVSLAKALADRPGLRLDITGAADSEVDGSALVEAKLLTQLKRAKFVQQPPSGDQASASVEQLELTPEEEAQYLKQLFVEKFGEAALTKVAETSDGKKSKADPRPLTPDEMKAKLLEGIVVDEAQLRVLAQERAQQIRESLIQEGKVPNNQVFLVEVVMTPETEEGKVRNPLALGAN